jgi:hypothetical protein
LSEEPRAAIDMADRLRAERMRDGVDFPGAVSEQLPQPIGLLGDFSK